MSTSIRSEPTRSVVVVNGVDRLAIADDGSLEMLTPVSTLGANDVPTRRQAGPVLGATLSMSGKTVDSATGIPTWVRRITVSFYNVSTNGTGVPQLRIGSGSLETTSYVGAAMSISGSSPGSTAIGQGASLTHAAVSAATVLHGSMVFTLVDSATNTWAFNGGAGRSDAGQAYSTFGSKVASGVIDRIGLTTSNGTDVFDSGIVSIYWE